MELDESIELKNVNENTEGVDVISMDVPLFIRMLEYGKEDAKTDMDLHKVTEKALELNKTGSLSMADYDKIVGKESLPENNNNDEKTNKMDKLKNLTVSEMRTHMHKMAVTHGMSECINEVLVSEGFLPNELSEGETYENITATLMEDDEIVSEIFKSCDNNTSECGLKIKEWISENVEENMDEISWGGIKNAGNYIKNAVTDKAKEYGTAIGDKAKEYGAAIGDKATEFGNAIGTKAGEIGSAIGTKAGEIGDSAERFGKNISQQYNAGVQNDITYKIEKIGEKLKQEVNSLNAAIVKAGGQKVSVQSVIATLANQLRGSKGANLSKYRTMNEGLAEKIFDGLSNNGSYECDCEDGSDFDVIQRMMDDGLIDYDTAVNDNGDSYNFYMLNDLGSEHVKDPSFIDEYINSYSDETIQEFDVNADSEDDKDEDKLYIKQKKESLAKALDAYASSVDTVIPMIDMLNPNDVIHTFRLKDGTYSNEGFKEFLIKSPEESGLEYYERLTNDGDPIYISILKDLSYPSKRRFLDSHPLKSPNFLDALTDVFEADNVIYGKRKDIARFNPTTDSDEETYTDDNDEYKPDVNNGNSIYKQIQADKETFDNEPDEEDEDEPIFEEVTKDLPKETKGVKGKYVDFNNKKNSEKDDKDMTKDAKASQETTEEKVDNLKNQKYELNDWEKNVKDTFAGWRNALDLDYTNPISDDQKKKIEDQAKGLAPKDHANVDHESTAGQKLIDAAKKRVDDIDITQNDYTSAHDRTAIEKEHGYKKTTAFNEEIERMKKMFSYEDESVANNRPNKTLNENDQFLKSVSKKKTV